HARSGRLPGPRRRRSALGGARLEAPRPGERRPRPSRARGAAPLAAARPRRGPALDADGAARLLLARLRARRHVLLAPAQLLSRSRAPPVVGRREPALGVAVDGRAGRRRPVDGQPRSPREPTLRALAR